ncbi:MAG: hypothetical protein P8Y51_05190, partial [Campylobacterales bacterium]
LTALLQHKAASLKAQGLMRFSMKQTVGDSTMVKNYPESYKGVLASAYKESAEQGTLPFFYALFFRFDTFEHLRNSGLREWFAEEALKHLHAYKPTPSGSVKTPMTMRYYEGIFETVIAGDKHGIYTTADAIRTFLKQVQEGSVTVGNHVTIDNTTRRPFETRVSALLKTAQNTYQPSSRKNDGLPGNRDNRHYKRAVTTEIMRNAFAGGGERNYIMHGTWESVWDHENSHLDPRFKMAAGPVGSFVIAGPVEPFYETVAAVD